MHRFIIDVLRFAHYLFYNMVLLVFDFTNQFLDFSYLREKSHDR